MYCIQQIVAFLCICCGLNIYGQSDHKVLLYTGTFSGNGSEGIYVCSFDTLTGTLEQESVIRGLENPNYLVRSSDGRFLYVCMRSGDQDSGGCSVGAFKTGVMGMAELINKQPSGGSDPCYIDITPDNRYLAVANYGSGTLALFTTNSDGSLNPACQVIQHSGNGPVEERQERAHAHSVRFSPFLNKVYAADLGIDKLMVYDLDRFADRLVESEIAWAEMAPGSGPRHFDFHPKGSKIYVVNELSSTLAVIDTEDNYKVIQSVSTLPENFKGVNYCADIHLSPSGKFVYCSNRGHNSITTFRVDEEGWIKRIAVTSSNGEWPRNFTISPHGNFLLVANQHSNKVSVFRINRETGIPVFIHEEISIPNPVCLVF
jgi:6-phosphogluconolactonase